MWTISKSAILKLFDPQIKRRSDGHTFLKCANEHFSVSAHSN